MNDPKNRSLMTFAMYNQMSPADRTAWMRSMVGASRQTLRGGTLYTRGNYTGVTTGALTNGTVDPSKSGVATNNSLAPTVNDSFSYTATDSTITWFFDGTNGSSQIIVRMADETKVGLSSGTITVGGLMPSTKYYFLPFYSVNNPCKTVSWVMGQTGTPQIAFTSVSLDAAQLQNLRNRIPLANGTMNATTAAAGASSSGTGGGSSGFVPGGCPRIGQVINSKSRGIIPVQSVRYGELIEAPCGWVKVLNVAVMPESEWVLMTTEDGEELEISTSTPQVMADGSRKPSPLLMAGDEILVREGYSAVLRTVEKFSEEGDKVLLSVDDESHLFYCGWEIPNIATVNINSKYTQ